MNFKSLLLSIVFLLLAFAIHAQSPGTINQKPFQFEKDLLLAQFDCKTDVDDLQSAAAFATLMANEAFSKVNYHAVAGCYGRQEGLYVPPDELFKLAFGNNWSDAHADFGKALDEVKALVLQTLPKGGDIWIAEAGQSDFSAELVKAVQKELPGTDISLRIHLVQHSNWNEEVTTAGKLDFVKKNIDYHKIPDGNTVGNGSPGFRSPEFTNWKEMMSDRRLMEIWQLAIDLSNRYNGKEGRYLNEAIAAGGLDFSDLSEVCWILGLQDIRDTEEFFQRYAR
ncbi:MAG: hypothetical protein U0T82_16340 [Bacteroidales bacterium]